MLLWLDTVEFRRTQRLAILAQEARMRTILKLTRGARGTNPSTLEGKGAPKILNQAHLVLPAADLPFVLLWFDTVELRRRQRLAILAQEARMRTILKLTCGARGTNPST